MHGGMIAKWNAVKDDNNDKNAADEEIVIFVD